MSENKEYRGNPQVTKSHYFTKDYLSRSRFEGLQGQISLCLESKDSDTFLEIGPGPGLLTVLLRHFGYKVKTIDIAFDLRPNAIGRLPELPFKDDAFDAVCAFEVLEHIPFNLFRDCIREIRRVSRRKVFISLPSQQEIYASQIRLDLILGRKKIRQVLWKRKLGKLTNPEEHFWEVEFDGIDSKTVIDACLQEGLTLKTVRFCPPWFQLFSFDK